MTSVGIIPSRVNFHVNVPAGFTGEPKAGAKPALGMFVTFNNPDGDPARELQVALPKGARVTKVYGDSPYTVQNDILTYIKPSMTGAQFDMELPASAASGFNGDSTRLSFDRSVLPSLVAVDGADPAKAGYTQPRSLSGDVGLPRGWEFTGSDQAKDGAHKGEVNHNVYTDLGYGDPLRPIDIAAQFTGKFGSERTTGVIPTARMVAKDAGETARNIILLPLALPFIIAMASNEG